jgi:DNA-binding NtrC family response regulator
MSLPVLVVEDRRSLAEMLAETLRREGYEVRILLRGDEAVAALARSGAYLAVLTDLKLPGADGLAVLRAARRADPSLPVFLITAYATVGTAVQALKEGARDYFQKPLDMDRVLVALRAAVEPLRALLGEEGEGVVELPEMVGSAPAFTAAVRALRRVAPTTAAVLLQGPSGSGKELFARSLHRLSERRDGPFVPFNCAAVPETLVEAELFGHERGAFTGATGRHAGRFEQAHGGTLFLDEVGEIPFPTQVKLLRALEEGRVSRLGGEEEVVVDVRLVAATNRDLAAALREGAFRRDLYHRLSVFPISLPALADRREDIPALSLHLLARAAARHGVAIPTLRPAAMAALTLAPWPGNVRELGNLLERALILAGSDRLGVEQLGLDAGACRGALGDEDVRRLIATLAGDEAADLACFLAVPLADLGS